LEQKKAISIITGLGEGSDLVKEIEERYFELKNQYKKGVL